jgi:hypothetical protein
VERAKRRWSGEPDIRLGKGFSVCSELHFDQQSTRKKCADLKAILVLP